ncbi:MAG: hypothetical protein QM473_12975 [Acidobacteriota bacterium]|nr:hypothetical protein [Acidobacteriota bacterium]
MSVYALLSDLALFALQVVALYSLSRILFVWVLQATVTRGQKGGWIINALRLPGNTIHELGHAIGYRLCGYRVKEVVSCLGDPEGRGKCVPGEAWCPLAVPWIATSAAAVFPLLFGTAILWALAEVLGIPLRHGGIQAQDGPLLYLWDSIREALIALDFGSWRTVVFLYLAFSIGAELAPSQSDLRQGMGPLLAMAGIVGIVALWLGLVHPDAPVWRLFFHGATRALELLSPLLVFGIITTGVAAVLLVPLAVVVRGMRRIFAV